MEFGKCNSHHQTGPFQFLQALLSALCMSNSGGVLYCTPAIPLSPWKAVATCSSFTGGILDNTLLPIPSRVISKEWSPVTRAQVAWSLNRMRVCTSPDRQVNLTLYSEVWKIVTRRRQIRPPASSPLMAAVGTAVVLRQYHVFNYRQIDLRQWPQVTLSVTWAYRISCPQVACGHRGRGMHKQVWCRQEVPTMYLMCRPRPSDSCSDNSVRRARPNRSSHRSANEKVCSTATTEARQETIQ